MNTADITWNEKSNAYAPQSGIVLSVNPSRKTLGNICNAAEMEDEATQEVNEAEDFSSTLYFINFLFPTRNSGFLQSVLTLLMRLGLTAGLLMIAWEHMHIAPQLSIGFLVLAILVFTGFLTRPATGMMCLMLVYVSGIWNTMTPIAAVLGIFLAAVLCLVGPGWFSFDALIRRSLVLSMRRKMPSKSTTRSRINYKAYLRSTNL